ncbi:MAG: hypothetical protein K2N62_10635, partial [Desulfovibrio sp.]|nr:hypothetical protein [Desulfovibrio sp.]
MAGFFRFIRIPHRAALRALTGGGPAAALLLAVALLAGSAPHTWAAGSLTGRQTIPFSQLNSLGGHAGSETAWPEAAPQAEKPGVVARALGAAPAQAATSGESPAAQSAPDGRRELGGRGVMDSRQALRGKVNAGGPEDWPEESGLSTATADVPRNTGAEATPASQPATPQAPDVAGQAASAPAQTPAAAQAPVSSPGPAQAPAEREIPPAAAQGAPAAPAPASAAASVPVPAGPEAPATAAGPGAAPGQAPAALQAPAVR